MRPDDGTGWPIATDERGDVHALECSPGRASTYWQACDQVDVPRERVRQGGADEVTCEACWERRYGP